MVTIPKSNTNQCYKTVGENKVYKTKLKTDIEAISEAKRLNVKPNMIHKVVAYKCAICGSYHVGKSWKFLKKDKNIYGNEKIKS